MKRNILLCILAVLVCGCNKGTDDQPTPITPQTVELETLPPQNLGSKGLKLLGRALRLNPESVIEHGFVVKYPVSWNQNDSIVYKIPSIPKSGSNYHIIENLPSGVQSPDYEIKYYIKAKNGSFDGDWLSFSYMPILVEPIDEITAQAGQQITIRGDFSNIDETYTIFTQTENSQDGNPVDYSVASDKKAITFIVPRNFAHGEERDFVLSSSNYLQTFLAKVFIIEHVLPLSRYKYFYTEQIDFSASGPTREMKKPLLLIIGDQQFPYSPSYSIAELLKNSSGTKFRVGYYNSRDTVIFPEMLELYKPDADAFAMRQSTVHPSGTTSVSAYNLSDHIPIYESIVKLGGKGAFLQTTWNGLDRLTIDDVPEGSYSVELTNHIYNYTSKQKVNVRKLKVSGVSPTTISPGDPVYVSGNFIEGDTYTMITDNGIQHPAVATSGTLELYPQNSSAANFSIQKIGYTNDRGHTIWTPVDLKVSYKEMTYTGFSPSSGTHDTKITLYGNGLRGGMIMIANQWVYSYESGPSFASIYIPRYILPGRHKIAVFYQNKWLTSDQIFELK